MVDWDDLEFRGWIFYKKFSDVPFTGKVTGTCQGTSKNGKEEGPWMCYHENGQLSSKGNYKNGEADGPWVNYFPNGTVDKRYSGTFKNGVKVSD